MGAELLVYDAESTFYIAVSLLHTNIKRVIGYGRSIRERHHPAIHIDAAAQHAQFIPMCKYGLHHIMLGLQRITP